MRTRPSLLSRLFLLLGILGAGFLVLSVYLYRATEGILTKELQRELTGDLQWMADLAEGDPELLEFPRVDSLAKAMSQYKGYRVTVIAPDGRVIGESHVPADRLGGIDNHGSRPEVVQARAEGIGVKRRHSETVRQEMFYVALAPSPDQAVLRISAGPATLGAFAAAARRVAAMALLLFLAAAAGITLWVSRRISIPLLRLRGEARDVSKPLRWDAPFREAEILNDAFVEYADAVQNLTARVRQERDRLLALLDRLEEGVVLLDSARRIRAVNASARRLLPLREDVSMLEGSPFALVVRHERLGRWVEQEQPGSARDSVLQIDKGPDSEYDLLCHLRVLQPVHPEGEMLLTLADVTRFRNLDRAKTDFVANASHELKTPLSSILGYAETLLDGAAENPAARDPFLRKIHANAMRLQGLVQDLLNLSRLESEEAPQVETLYVRDFVQSAWNAHRAAAERVGIRFENRVPWELTWRMEPRDLDRILGNLVGNAVKYNLPGGKVRVDWDPEACRLSVQDTGPGIPEAALSRIFERFYRGDSARARNEGTGLGLAIVKHAAQRYGMQVWAESIMGEGSRFVVEASEEMAGN